MAIKPLQVNLKEPVVWDNPLSKIGLIDGNELLAQVDRVIFNHREDSQGFSNRVKCRYYHLMGHPKTEDKDWAMHHIADDVDKLRRAIVHTFKKEISQLHPQESEHFLRRVGNLITPDELLEIGDLPGVPERFDRLFHHNPGFLYETFIAHDDPEYRLKKAVSTQFCYAVNSYIQDGSMASPRIVIGSWRDLTNNGKKRAKFLVERHEGPVPFLTVSCLSKPA